jgi:hypothetical protein
MRKTLILSLVFYGNKIWSHTSREEYRRRVFENRILGRKFGPMVEDKHDNGENCDIAGNMENLRDKA